MVYLVFLSHEFQCSGLSNFAALKALTKTSNSRMELFLTYTEKDNCNVAYDTRWPVPIIVCVR